MRYPPRFDLSRGRFVFQAHTIGPHHLSLRPDILKIAVHYALRCRRSFTVSCGAKLHVTLTGMGNNISKDELAILAYLHEHAEGYTQEFQMTPGEVAQAMRIDLPKFQKDASYLAAHGLVGMQAMDASSDEGRLFLFVGIWLTGDGENFMRELENQPGIAQRITTKTASAIYDTAKAVIVKALGDYLGGRL